MGTVLGLSILVFLCGCHAPNPHLPIDWNSRPVDPLTFKEDGPQSVLHVFIIYASNMCSHTVLRVWDPELGVVFWDPAGGYGKPDYPVVATRIRDLVVNPTPSILDYLEFRQYLPTDSMEIFEFELESELAQSLIQTLHTGLKGGRGAYDTKTDPFFCSSSISKFLAEQAPSRFPISKTFYPHDFAKHLYQLHPDRVLLYDESGIRHYFPSESVNL